MDNAILPFSEEDALSSTGERIVADRYLLKDAKKESLTPGSLVVAVLDRKRAYHELARVLELDHGNKTAIVELRDGYQTELSYDHIDVLKEVAPRQMWRRIARGVAQVTKDSELYEEQFYNLQSQWRYVPGGRINASMGTGIQTTSYNCFVIPNVGWQPRDYARSFGQTLEIQARSGGVGMNLSQVPPQGTLVPVQDRSRKADLLLALDVWHEDLIDFLETEYPNSTKVVRVSKAFLRAVEEGADWTYVSPDTTAVEYDEVWNGDLEAWLAADRPIRYGATLSAQVLYDKIIESDAQMLQDFIGVVLQPGDSRGTIAERLGDMWEAMREGRRVTMLLSSLRPRYSYVRGVNGRSSGAFSWGLLYDKGNTVFGQGFGPVGVGEIMSVGCQLTLQGGSRRGALMLILNDRHADIIKFIKAKQVDGVITGANISVGISEQFMAAKKAGLTWTLGYPPIAEASEFDGDFFAWENSDRSLETAIQLPAAALWDELTQSAWQSAEPGVVFLGRYNKMSNSNYFNPIIATNPCFHPDVRIATEFGLVRIEDLYKQVGQSSFSTLVDNRSFAEAKEMNGRTYAIAGTSLRTATVFPTGVRKTVVVALHNGMELAITRDHRLLTVDGWKAAGELTTTDSVFIQSGMGAFPDRDDVGADMGHFLGWLTSDGGLSKRSEIGRVFGRDDADAIAHFLEVGRIVSGDEASVSEQENGTFNVFWSRSEFRKRLEQLSVLDLRVHEKRIPEAMFTAAQSTAAAYLQALFCADGTVHEADEHDSKVQLSSLSRKFLQDVQLLLLQFGIHGKIYTRPANRQTEFSYESFTGETRVYQSSENFDLILSGNNIVMFQREIGFAPLARKQAALDRIARLSRHREQFESQVLRVTEGDEVTVYDITEKTSHSLVAAGIVAHNCGEQGLPAFGICNLGAVVLSQFAVGFSDSGERVEFRDAERENYIRGWLAKYFEDEKVDFYLHHIKWEELEEITRTGLRFQDAVIDATYYPFEDNRRNQLSERRVGLGIMGLHDLLLYCGVRYGSQESVYLIDVLIGMMAEWCYLESVELAKENGPFPMFAVEPFLASGYMQTMMAERPHVVAAIREHGVRNVTTMTIAPTGTTGTMVGCSTGCEPYYAWSYFRNSRLGMFEENAEIIMAYHATHSESDGKLPDYFVTSMDLTPEEHVRVQAALQKWIDSSISKTCNAPNDYSVEDTKQLYDLAYDLGCKGVTIYRDGSRSEQVLSLTDPDEAKSGGHDSPTVADEVRAVGAEHIAETPLAEVRRQVNQGYVKRKRPDVLYGATYKKETPLGTAFITINDDHEENFAREIFVNIGKAGSDVYAANEALGRAITLYLMDSQNPDKEAVLVKHFSGIGGHSSVGFGERRITSVPDAIAKSLIEHSETFPLRHLSMGEISATVAEAQRLGKELSAHDLNAEEASHGGASQSNLSDFSAVGKASRLRDAEVGRDLCPECHQHSLVRHGGCYECEACGYSKC